MSDYEYEIFEGPDAEYRLLASQWSPPEPVEKIAHPLRAPEFIKQLVFMRDLMRERGYMPWDQYFHDALELIRETGMTLPGGEWNPWWMDIRSSNTDDSMAMELVDNLLSPRKPASKRGGVTAMPISRRMAIATAVAEYQLRGNSFEAACKRLQRLLDEREKNASA